MNQHVFSYYSANLADLHLSVNHTHLTHLASWTRHCHSHEWTQTKATTLRRRENWVISSLNNPRIKRSLEEPMRMKELGRLDPTTQARQQVGGRLQGSIRGFSHLCQNKHRRRAPDVTSVLFIAFSVCFIFCCCCFVDGLMLCCQTPPMGAPSG